MRIQQFIATHIAIKLINAKKCDVIALLIPPLLNCSPLDICRKVVQKEIKKKRYCQRRTIDL